MTKYITKDQLYDLLTKSPIIIDLTPHLNKDSPFQGSCMRITPLSSERYRVEKLRGDAVELHNIYDSFVEVVGLVKSTIIYGNNLKTYKVTPTSMHVEEDCLYIDACSNDEVYVKIRSDHREMTKFTIAVDPNNKYNLGEKIV